MITIAVAVPLLDLIIAMMGAAVVGSLWRLTRGPTLADRVVALDLIGTIAVGIIALYSVKTSEPVLLLVSIVLALIMFLGTIAFSLYIQKGGTTRGNRP